MSKTLAFLWVFCSLTVFGQSEKQYTTEGTIIDVRIANEHHFEELLLRVATADDTLDFYSYGYLTNDQSGFLNEKVQITYFVTKTNKEIDMFYEGVSVHDSSYIVRDTTNSLTLEGLFDVHNYGCAMPGSYTIESADSTITKFVHYMSEKQGTFEGKHVSVSYYIESYNCVLDMKFLTPEEDTVKVTGTEPTSFFRDQTIRIIDVTEDSRCPTDAICKWAGNVKIDFELNKNYSTYRFTLNTNANFETETTIDGLHIKLDNNISPAKVKGEIINLDQYSATLIITDPIK